jgi:hypothetical protein
MKKIDQLAQEAALNSGLVTLDFGNRPVQVELDFAVALYRVGFEAAREMAVQEVTQALETGLFCVNLDTIIERIGEGEA